MAYVQGGQDDEEELKKQQGAPQTIAGTDLQAAPNVGSAAGPTAGSAQSPSSAGVSDFTNVGAYLDANRDQSQDLANKVSQQFGKDATLAQNDISQTANQFRGQVDQTAVNPDAGLVNRAAADPTGFASNPDDLAKFMQMRTANYQGPTQFEAGNDYSRLTGEVNNAIQNQGNVNTEQGRQSLLYQMGNNPTSGQVSLDQLLLGANPQARDTLSHAANQFSGLHDFLSSTATSADQYANQAKQNTGQASQLVADKFTNPQTGVIPQFQNNLQQRATTAESQRQLYNTNLNDVIGRMNQGQSVTPEEAQQLGLQPGQLESLYAMNANAAFQGQQAVNPTQYLMNKNPVNTAATISNVASPEDVAKAAALQQLMGAPAVQGFDPTQAGKFNVPTSIGSYLYGDARQAGINHLMQIDKDMLAQGPPLGPGTNANEWLINAKLAQQRIDNPSMYDQPYQNYAPTPSTPTLGGGLSNVGNDPTIDPLTGKPYPIFNPQGTNTTSGGGGRAFR